MIEKSNVSPEGIEKFTVLKFDENAFPNEIVEESETVAENSFV